MNNFDIRSQFRELLVNKQFTTDKNGGRTLEILGASFKVNANTLFGEVNKEYVDAELAWYRSRSTNIYDIWDKAPPTAWLMTANKHGEINSNYGHLIYSELYHEQYEQALSELECNDDTRRATMVYTRPSIWTEFKDAAGKNDFICTNAVTYYKRNGHLDAVVQMRSNDAVYGFKNDLAWQTHVINELLFDLNDGTTGGDIYWQVQNLHVYENHFHLI